MSVNTTGSLIAASSAIAIFIFTGCTPAAHKALRPADLTAITQTHLRTTVTQDEVSIAVEKSTSGDVIGAGGGVCCILVGSMIDKAVDDSRSAKAEKWVTPLLEQAPDLDFRKDYWDALLPTLRSLQWLKLGETELRSKGDDEVPPGWLRDDVLKVTASYQLSPDGRRLIVGSLVQLWMDPKPKLKSKPAYFAFHTYVSKPVQAAKGEASVALWAADRAELYRATLREGIQESMRMLRLDLPDAEQRTEHLAGTPASITALSPITGRHETFNGEIVDRDTNRVIARDKSGNLRSMAIPELGFVEKGRRTR